MGVSLGSFLAIFVRWLTVDWGHHSGSIDWYVGPLILSLPATGKLYRR